jgi:peptidyl-prolyl cis-trans isomerase A (cyclophilin A)
MKYILTLILALSALPMHAQETIKCRIETTIGDIELELFAAQAPVTVSNFLKYVDAELYTNSSFFRVCTPENEAERKYKIEVIQGGNLVKKPPFEPIKIETTEQTGILHQNGTLSMARSGPNTATSQFFICLGDQPELDFQGRRNPDGFGFAAFGEVTNGMDIVRRIQQGENKKQRLVAPVKILSVKRLE